MPDETFVWGSKHPPNLNPGGCRVESTARNYWKHLRKRVADCKHGFESRWGTKVNSLGFCGPGFRNTHVFLEPGARTHPHSANIRSAFSS